MENCIVKINYLYNSGFCVETPSYILIFDYYKDSVDSGDKKISNGAVGQEDLMTDKKVLVFSSHSHGDHFNPVILEWRRIRPDIKYIFSSDIEVDKKDDNIYFLSVYETLNLNDVYVKAYGSTDIGISFLVKVDGISIFHAGDLNWWYWCDDTKEEIEKAETWFKKEVSRIKGENIDIAFFPVDSRLEHNYSLGAEYFISEVKPKFLIPMHFREDYEATKRFYVNVKNSPTRVFKISKRGEKIVL